MAVFNAVSRTVSVLLDDGAWPGTKTFVGFGGAGSRGNWATANNWSPAGVPAPGDHVSVAGKAVNVAGNASVVSLSLSGGATLSVASPIGAWNGANYSGVTGMIARGYTYGEWTGTGLVTTTAQARSGVTTLAVAEAARLFELTGNETALFSGQTIDATAVLVKYTYSGDVNLAGTIDGADYGLIDSPLQLQGTPL